MCSRKTVLVEEVDIFTADEFKKKAGTSRKPYLLKKLNIGPAPSLWTPEYLRDRCGERSVRVHVTPVTLMDFMKKNFLYRYVNQSKPSECAGWVV